LERDGGLNNGSWRRFTFDVGRPLTSLDHLIRDNTEGPECSRESHFRSEMVDHKTGDALEPEVRRSERRGRSVDLDAAAS
jgi:hypothetical protein